MTSANIRDALAPVVGRRPGGRTVIYVASKSKHGVMWRHLRADGIPIASTWIDEWEQGASDDLADLWVRCIGEVGLADALIAYHEPGDKWKGAFIEIGAALANGIPVYVVGDPPGSWVNHPLVHRCRSVGDALQEAGQ
jgi:hypothetical protein